MVVSRAQKETDVVTISVSLPDYVSTQTLATGPKADAIVLLGSLYTYPWADESLKQQIVVTIKDVAKTESDQFNRYLTVKLLVPALFSL